MYSIEVKKSAGKELLQIPTNSTQKIIEAINGLAENPRRQGVKKLKGEEAYRIRSGDYKIVYTIKDVIKIVEVQRIRHRKDVYR